MIRVPRGLPDLLVLPVLLVPRVALDQLGLPAPLGLPDQLEIRVLQAALDLLVLLG